ncbi:helix-turn-helix domain-containing protein [Spirillospora sp. NPDC050679]
MAQRPNRFGEELRRRRGDAALSLSALGSRVGYSKSQLSKIETGRVAPNRTLARLCDTVLGARGELAALVPEAPVPAEPAPPVNGDEEVWSMSPSSDDQNRFPSLTRRQAMTAGAVSAAGMGIGRPILSSAAENGTLLGVSRSLFDQYRKLGQTVEPGVLLPVLVAQTHTLRELSQRAGSRTRQALLRLGSRYAEYVGWLVQETGDDQNALWWTRRAVDLAEAGEDRDLAAYSSVRHALITLYRDDAPQTIELAQRAQERRAPHRIRGLAAQREAQGHALAGDYDATMRCLDRARMLLARHVPDSDAPVIGTMHLPDPAEMVRGWCLYDLGRPGTAAEVIDRQLVRVPGHAVRTQVRYGVRRALALATAGEVDHACHLTRELLDDTVAVGTATIATDLRSLARTLARHPRNRSVRDLLPALGTALHTIVP